MRTMKFLFLILLFFVINQLPAYCAISGGVEKSGYDNSSKVFDAKTKEPIKNAKISIPQLKYSTRTDDDGKFYLDAQIQGTNIMSVEKDGYRPFSLTLDEKPIRPLTIGIEKTSPKDIILDKDLIHLGDNNFSPNSANANEFRLSAMGSYYNKIFPIKTLSPNETAYFIIGSIIGIDTQLAQQLGQSQAKSAYSSPPEIYFNGQKIAEIKANGDGQKIRLPNSLISQTQLNEITIKTGKNLFQYAYTDYDDIELMNLFIEVE